MSKAISTTILGVLVAVTCFLSTAASAIRLDPQGCQGFAEWAGNLAWAKSIGADKARARQSLLDTIARTGPSDVVELALREFEPLWAERRSWERAAGGRMEECYAKRGEYGEPA